MSIAFTVSGLNDLLRTTFLTGKVVLTEGISALSQELQSEVLTRVRCYTVFGPDNDPHSEHDFGAFDLEGAGRIFWKIDYYDRTLCGASPDPADPHVTTRVLTIMLAEEY